MLPVLSLVPDSVGEGCAEAQSLLTCRYEEEEEGAVSPQAGVCCSRFYLLTPLALCFLPSACGGCPALHPAEAKGAHPLAEHQRPGGTVPGLFWDDPARELPGTALQAVI